MSLNITTQHAVLKKEIDRINADNRVSFSEFQHVRDAADTQIEKLKAPELQAHLKKLQKSVDDAVEALQQVALAAKKAKLDEPTKAALKESTSYQIAYLVMGFKTSVDRL
ncbi:hypothetical protein A176_002294 [Myxococcus hansupus]|uniref:Uncharacterized protein n=1 Tax=Pseudomyxococcus hansupus TaxID=1297742 RepID=A0A0H4XBQ6_9BACT|nr:hypothetical protein [Myxococcus hansupus]AKQ65382.1 hypothetical protein A176_002294 [Myxococcus hansupus]